MKQERRPRPRHRLLSTSSTRETGGSAPAALDPWDWRDWPNLLPDLVEDISGRLLSFDVADYIRFRAVCCTWRRLTADPRGAGPLDSRFRPRNWAVLTSTPDSWGRRRRRRRQILNLATGASLAVDLPALASSGNCYLCVADGLLVLLHRPTKTIRLLDPLSNAVTHFPAIPSLQLYPELILYRNDSYGSLIECVDGAALDDSTSPPTLVLCVRIPISMLIVARPGDARWTAVTPGKASYPILTAGEVLYETVLCRGGRCYVNSPEGSVYVLELTPPLPPRLVDVVDQRHVCPPKTHHLRRVISFLVGGDGGSMMMVRYWRNIKHFGGRQAYNPTELFTVDGVTGRMEVLEVDLAARTLVPVRSLGRHRAAFIGHTSCLLLSTETFPSITAGAIYLGYLDQRMMKLGIYHVGSRRTEPPHLFRKDEYGRVIPCARPCNLDQYLVCYVDSRHALSGAFNHPRDTYH